MQSILFNKHLNSYVAVEDQLSDLMFEQGWRLVFSDRYIQYRILTQHNCEIVRQYWELYDDDGNLIPEQELLASIEAYIEEQEAEDEIPELLGLDSQE
jgi:hypothetical protein